MKVQENNNVSVVVDVDIDDVWRVVSDPTRVGEWSNECIAAEWLGDSTAALPGARFRGRNRNGIFRWGRVCEIVSADPYELVWVTVSTTFYPDSTEWRITLEKVDGGTRINQKFDVVRAPKVLSFIYALMVPSHRDRTAELEADLRRLGETARSAGLAAGLTS